LINCSAELPLELRYTPKYLYPFALLIGTLFTLNILSWSFPVLLNTTDLVFYIFINDLIDSFDESCKPAILNTLKLHCLLYADDLVLMSETADG
jgi:hypothetical protein